MGKKPLFRNRVGKKKLPAFDFFVVKKDPTTFESKR
jgi:hypothetical protein